MPHRTFRDQDPANVEAAELVGRLHDALANAGHRGHDLERFLVRVVFCMFADDTGVFEPRDIFLDFIETRTGEDGADLGPWLAQLFEVLDTPEGQRAATLDEALARFPYVNGDLFEGHPRTFSFDAAMRMALLDACRFDWSKLSPAIFGALFQSVMDPAERRAQGAHYTTEKNILKVIEPLFMDDLRAEFERLKSRKDSRRLAELRRFQAKLGGMMFFDPACGCGNFLVIAYRELRLLEIEVIREIRDATAATTPTLYHVNVIPTAPFLVIPEVSSERREYAPIGWLGPPVIPSNKLRLLSDVTLVDFALLTSAMHMAWTRYIGGRLESRYQYSVGINYNTFPTPPEGADLSKLETLAQDVLDARRPLRPRSHAAESASGASGARPRGGPALSARRVRFRTRARRTPVHAL